MPTVGPNYVATGGVGSSAITGTWATLTNAEGNTPTTAATWTDATRSSTATWQGTGFGFTSASIPSGGVLNSISITVRHSESSVTILSLTGQLYYSGTAVGTAHTITQSTTAADATWTVTDLGLYSNLANFQVRVVATRTNTTTSTVQSIFDCSITLTYTAVGVDTYTTTIANDQPVAYWRLGDVGTTAADATGNGHPGTLAGGVTTGVAGAISGSADTAMTFNGTTGVITVATFPALGAKYSYECWFNVASATATQELINDPSNNIALYIATGVVNWYVTTTAPQATCPTSQWVHGVGTADGTTVALYLNGSSVASVTSGSALGTAGTMALARSAGGFNFLAGSLDEVAVYNYALTSTQVAAHYAAGAPAAAQIWQPPSIRKMQAVQRASTW